MARLKEWCEDVNRVQSDGVYDFVYRDGIIRKQISIVHIQIRDLKILFLTNASDY